MEYSENEIYTYIREAANKNNGIFLVTRPLRGGGVRAWPQRKIPFFEALKKQFGIFLWPLRSRGEGVRP